MKRWQVAEGLSRQLSKLEADKAELFRYLNAHFKVGLCTVDELT